MTEVAPWRRIYVVLLSKITTCFDEHCSFFWVSKGVIILNFEVRLTSTSTYVHILIVTSTHFRKTVFFKNFSKFVECSNVWCISVRVTYGYSTYFLSGRKIFKQIRAWTIKTVLVNWPLDISTLLLLLLLLLLCQNVFWIKEAQLY